MTGGPRISTGPEFFNSVANNPELFPTIAASDAGPFDFTNDWHDCIGVEFDRGGWMFARYTPALYEAHTLFLPDAGDLREPLMQALSLMFYGTDAEAIVCKAADIPGSRLASLLESVGFRWMFRREGASKPAAGVFDVDYYQLALGDWIPSSPYLIQLGQEQLGSDNTDLSRAAYIGFVEACTQHGKHRKGVTFHNVWALLTNTPQIEPAPDLVLPTEGPGSGAVH